MAFSAEQAKFLIDHCFLPPKLPAKSDEESGADALLVQLEGTAQAYFRNLDQDE